MITKAVTRETFDRLADAWEAHVHASRASSNPRVYVEHATFDALVALGEDAVPFALERYRAGPLFWGAVLARITGDTSKGDGLSGNLKDTRARWLAETRA